MHKMLLIGDKHDAEYVPLQSDIGFKVFVRLRSFS